MIWDMYLEKLGDGWDTYALGDSWRVLVNDEEDPVLCEEFANLAGKTRIEQTAFFDQGWVVTKRGARISPEAMRALLDAWREKDNGTQNVSRSPGGSHNHRQRS